MEATSRDPLTNLKRLATRWRTAADSLSKSADLAAEEFRSGEALDSSEPACVKGIRDCAATYRACALEVETVVMREEARTVTAGEWGR